jgi:hypothetical protein
MSSTSFVSEWNAVGIGDKDNNFVNNSSNSNNNNSTSILHDDAGDHDASHYSLTLGGGGDREMTLPSNNSITNFHDSFPTAHSSSASLWKTTTATSPVSHHSPSQWMEPTLANPHATPFTPSSHNPYAAWRSDQRDASQHSRNGGGGSSSSIWGEDHSRSSRQPEDLDASTSSLRHSNNYHHQQSYQQQQQQQHSSSYPVDALNLAQLNWSSSAFDYYPSMDPPSGPIGSKTPSSLASTIPGLVGASSGSTSTWNAPPPATPPSARRYLDALPEATLLSDVSQNHHVKSPSMENLLLLSSPNAMTNTRRPTKSRERQRWNRKQQQQQPPKSAPKMPQSPPFTTSMATTPLRESNHTTPVTTPCAYSPHTQRRTTTTATTTDNANSSSQAIRQLLQPETPPPAATTITASMTQLSMSSVDVWQSSPQSTVDSSDSFPILPIQQAADEWSLDPSDEDLMMMEDMDKTSTLSPSSKKKVWLMRMNRKLQETPIGTLDPTLIPIAAIMNAWAKTKSAQGAHMVEQWLQRAQDEYEAGNTRIVPTTKLYTMAVDAWARSGEGGAAAQRAEALLQRMNKLYVAGNHEALKPTVRGYVSCTARSLQDAQHPDYNCCGAAVVEGLKNTALNSTLNQLFHNYSHLLFSTDGYFQCSHQRLGPQS